MGLTIAVHNSVVVYPLSQFGSDEQKAKFLPPLAAGEKIGAFCLTESNAGSDALSIESTAIRDGESYIVNANKIFVTNGGVADTLIIFTSVKPGEEFIFVYKGEFELTLGGKVFHLKQGETIHFDSETRHKLRNISDEKCELLVTLYTP
ncbi:MAG: hypothetical protein A2V86_08795 [Deltaproteobacteria bacterium RBG_16_49_23]|nr:MAG: hypothetical protein A2V86_08795 [Deltaproteobacteria bacterium RBG_16_49_23]